MEYLTREDLSLRITKDLIEMPEAYQLKHEIKTIDDKLFND